VVMGLVPIMNMPSVTKSIDDGFPPSISSMSPILSVCDMVPGTLEGR